MELGEFVLGFGLMTLVILGFSGFILDASTTYNSESVDSIAGFNMSAEYKALVQEDFGDLQNGTITQGEDFNILESASIVVKQWLNSPKWAGLITNFANNLLTNLPIPIEMILLISTIILSIIAYAVLSYFLRWKS